MDLLDPSALLQAVGPWALLVMAVILFIENGLLFPFLPGDSLAFAAAAVAGKLGLPLPLIILTAIVAAFVGGEVGYLIGGRIGPRLFKEGNRILKPVYRDRSAHFFEKYGPRAIVLARFVPIVRTYIAPIAGFSDISFTRFTVWNAVGAAAWAIVIGVAGFLLGKIPFVADNVELIAVALVVVSVVPIAIGALVDRRKKRRSENSGGAAS